MFFVRKIELCRLFDLTYIRSAEHLHRVDAVEVVVVAVGNDDPVLVACVGQIEELM